MTNTNTEQINKNIGEICDKYQSERVNGQWYIEQTGLNKIANILGGNYKNLTKKQRVEFRADCINKALKYMEVRSWWYYLNCA